MKKHMWAATAVVFLLLVAHTVAVRRYVLHLASEQRAVQQETMKSATAVLSSIAELRERMKSDTAVLSSIAELKERMNYIEQTNKVRPVPSLSYRQMDGKLVKTLGEQLDRHVDVLLALSARPSLLNWSGETPLPVMWPKNYPQDFNPHTFLVNAAFLAQAMRTGEDQRTPSAISYLRRQLESHTRDDKVFFTFAQKMLGGVLEPGWTSAFANAVVVIGFVELYDATREAVYLQEARRYLGPLRWESRNSEIVRLDEANYLWFDETPPINGKPTGVLNGHVAAVLAFYRYWQVTGDEAVVPYILAGAATAARYYWSAREPGKAPHYWTYSAVPDYGPRRAINQLNTLYKITGVRTFKEQADAILTDSPIE